VNVELGGRLAVGITYLFKYRVISPLLLEILLSAAIAKRKSGICRTTAFRNIHSSPQLIRALA
jgi:hypothetical protein